MRQPVTNGGDAVEQLIRVSLNGAEVVLRLAGAATKELATFLVAACKNPQKKKDKNSAKYGATRLKTMLRCGKPTEIFSVKEADLKKFVDGAKKYGILYCVVKKPKNCPDNLCDIVVKADDAPKIRRIAERYGFATLSKATVEHARERAARNEPENEPEPDSPNRDTADDLVSDLLGGKEGKEQGRPNPDSATMDTPHPSAPSYENKSSSAVGTFDQERPSVREELREIKEARRTKKPDVPMLNGRKLEAPPTIAHKQPARGRNTKKQIRRNTR